MRTKGVSKIVIKITAGLTDKIIDLVLLSCLLLGEMAPYQKGSLGQKMSRIDRGLGSLLERKSVLEAFSRARKLGWINQELKITKKGQEKLKNVLPKYSAPQKWDGNWYVVAYDIPEEKRWLRKVVKEKLEELGFGLLHKSVWISPYNFLGDVEKIVKQYTLESWVILLISNKVGREPSENLAGRIWGLERMNNLYKEFVRNAENKKLAKTQIAFEYLSILNQDPQLPEELLPDDWQAEKAYNIYKKLLKK